MAKRLITAGASVVVIVGAVHLPVVQRSLRSSLAFLCPAATAAPADVERLHATAMAALAGERVAPASHRFALRMLGVPHAVVTAWAAQAHVDCDESTRGFTFVSCRQASMVVADWSTRPSVAGEIVFSLDRSGRTIGVDLLTRMDTSEGTSVASALAENVRAALGVPSEHLGDFTGAGLRVAFRPALVRYRFADAVITVSAMNVPGSGIVVREQTVAVPATRAVRR